MQDREVGKAVFPEDGEQGASLIQGKDSKMLKWMCSCGSRVDVSVLDAGHLNNNRTKLHMETPTAPGLWVIP